MTSASLSGDGREPFPESGLDALLTAASRDCPDAVLMRDDDGPSTAADLARRVCLLAALFRAAALVPGERVLILAGAQTAAFVALVAALRAGLEPALAPCGIGPIEIAAHAQAAAAVALVGPARYGALELGESYLSAAAIAESVRMVATQGPEPVDGAADVSFARLDGMRESAPDEALVPDAAHETAVIATFQGAPTGPVLITHRQATLFADALSLVEQARINPSKRIISTLPPASLAGLVAGPFAALIGASSLVLHGPFDAVRFLAACDVERGFHLVAPGAIGPMFVDKALAADLTSLILVSRFAGPTTFVLPPPVACERPIVDVYAFGEDTLLAQRRTDGQAHPPIRVPDKSVSGGLGARLNRARAEHRLHGTEGI